MKWALICALLTVTEAAFSQSYFCRDVFHKRSAVVQELHLKNPIPQLLLWEQTANLPEFHKPTEPVMIESAEAPRQAVDIKWAGSEDLRASIEGYFKISRDAYLWPQHPYNDESRVPFYGLPESHPRPVYFSASRSLFFWVESQLFSYRTPTNFPHRGIEQPSKADLRDIVKVATERTKHIQTMDQKLGKPKTFQILFDVLSLIEKETGNGISVRDLTPLQDGNYYLPGFAIPYFGKTLAERHGENFDIFWKKHYAEPVGRVKALLLLRYGLQMATPNSQNFLIQLDSNLHPTGKIYIRDLTDADFVSEISEHLGFTRQLDFDRSQKLPVADQMDPSGDTSFFLMTKSGSVATATVEKWVAAHNEAYLSILKRELGLTEKSFTIFQLYKFLQSEMGSAALKNYSNRIQDSSSVCCAPNNH
ncbi:MAG: hypothetical protein K2Q26_14130 [Bdellovibrionales bacterium]|nr:hypothetical protein [Bdellovibrionales bacterium]